MTRALSLVLALLTAAVVAAVVVVRTEPDWYERLRYPLSYESIVVAHARNYDLDPALVAAVIYTESRFRADAESGAGAIGLMQLLPDTAKGIAVRTGGRRFTVADLYDPELNVRYGSWYLRALLDRYGDQRIALAAYHAGQGNVDRWRARGAGIVFPETKGYVEDVLDVRKVYARVYADELETR